MGLQVRTERLARARRHQADGEPIDAERLCRQILRHDPGHGDALHLLGVTLAQRDQLDAAESVFRRAIEACPSFAAAHGNLANVLNQRQQFDEAQATYRRAIELDPEFGAAYHNYADLLIRQGRLPEATALYRRASELLPSHAGVHNSLARALERIGDTKGAFASYARALECDPELVDAHRNRSQLLLSVGEFAAGWDEYEWRMRHLPYRASQFERPRWDGRSRNAQSILVCGEQGIGDEIMFASCLHPVITRSQRCYLECDRRLVPLFQRSFPTVSVLATPEDTQFYDTSHTPATSCVISSGSLPRLFRRSAADFPHRRSFLVPDAVALERWTGRLGALGPGLKVGIAWRGGLDPDVQRMKSTELGQWQRVLRTPGATFVNLQHGDVDEEIDSVHREWGVRIHDWDDSDPLNDLDDFAAKVAALDLVISVSNATVHLAGALGVEVHVLLPTFAGWRWMREGSHSVWYSSARLIRQQTPGEWEPLFEQIAEQLQTIIRES